MSPRRSPPELPCCGRRLSRQLPVSCSFRWSGGGRSAGPPAPTLECPRAVEGGCVGGAPWARGHGGGWTASQFGFVVWVGSLTLETCLIGRAGVWTQVEWAFPPSWPCHLAWGGISLLPPRVSNKDTRDHPDPLTPVRFRARTARIEARLVTPNRLPANSEHTPRSACQRQVAGWCLRGGWQIHVSWEWS